MSVSMKQNDKQKSTPKHKYKDLCKSQAENHIKNNNQKHKTAPLRPKIKDIAVFPPSFVLRMCSFIRALPVCLSFASD